MRRTIAILHAASRALWRFPLRSGLTILGAVLGVAGALSSVNYALGGRQKVINQLARLGTNVLIASPQQSQSVAGRARTGALATTLTNADYLSVTRDLPQCNRSSAVSSRTFLVKAGDLAKNSCTVIGIEPAYMKIRNWPVQSGSLFDVSDLRRLARVAVLGSGVARDLFPAGPPSPGDRITINRVPFQVAGVMTERGQGLDAANEDDQIYVPLTTAMHRLANVEYFSSIVFEVRDWEQMDVTAEQVRELLRRRHRRIGKLAEDFSVQNQKQLIDTQVAASQRLLFLVQAIGATALSVSGLGVLAIAWIGVKERTSEIGTRRALGAERSDIFMQIVAESALLSLVGCIAGFGVSWGCSHLLAMWAGQPAAFDRSSAVLAIGSSIGLNLIFALVPARTAARLDPIQALRFE